MRLFFISCLLVLQAYGSMAQPKKTISLLDLEAGTMDQNLAVMMTERLRTELTRTDLYIVLNREEIRTRLGKEDFHKMGLCNTTPCIMDYGRKLMTDYLVTGSIRGFGGTQVIVLRLVDMASKKVTNIVTKRYEGKPTGINPVIAEAGRELVGISRPSAPVVPAVSVAVTTVLGEELEPEPPEEQPVQRYDPVQYAVGLLRYNDGNLQVFKDNYTFESKQRNYQVPFKAISHMEYVSLYDETLRVLEALLVVYAEHDGKKKKFLYVDFGLTQAKEFSRLVGCNLYVKKQSQYGEEIR